MRYKHHGSEGGTLVQFHRGLTLFSSLIFERLVFILSLIRYKITYNYILIVKPKNMLLSSFSNAIVYSVLYGLLGIYGSLMACIEEFESISKRPYTYVPEDPNNKASLMIGEKLYGTTLESCIQKRLSLYERSKQIFLNLKTFPTEGIPHKTHRMWITHQENPVFPPEEIIQNYLNSVQKLPPDWEHHFWCMDQQKLQPTLEKLKSTCPTLQTHDIKEIFPSMKAKHLFDAYYQERRYSAAGNVARQNIIFQRGGIYSDMGTLLQKDLTPYVDAYDRLFWYNGLFIDQSFFGYKKGDSVFKRYLENLDKLYDLSPEIKALTPSIPEHHQWNSPPHIMAMIDHFSLPTDRFLFVQEGENSLFKIDHLNTWLGSGAFGSIPLSQSQLNILEIKPPF